MRIICLTHISFEGPGAIAEWAESRGHSLEIAPLYSADWAHPADHDFVIVMGGPMSIHEESEFAWLAAEKAYLQAVATDGRTLVLGVCLGAQLLADALGGSVAPGEAPEIGWYPVELTEQGRALGVFASLPGSFPALHWHGDRFTIPPHAVHVARSEACDTQAFASDGGRVVGLQFHLEATPESWSALCDAAPDELDAGGEWVSSAGAMLGDRALFEDIRELLFGVLDAMAGRRSGA